MEKIYKQKLHNLLQTKHEKSRENTKAIKHSPISKKGFTDGFSEEFMREFSALLETKEDSHGC